MGHDHDFVHRFEPGSEPALLLLHGTGGDENDLIPLAQKLLPGAALLSPRGRVLEQGMPRFFRRVAMGVFDQADLALRTDELAAFVSEASRGYGLDPTQLTLLGYSNGANIGASLLLRHPGLIRSAVLLHAMLPFEPERHVELAGTRVLLTSGEQDPWIPVDQALALERLLTSAGATVLHEVFPGGHQIGRAELERVAGWLQSNNGTA